MNDKREIVNRNNHYDTNNNIYNKYEKGNNVTFDIKMNNAVKDIKSLVSNSKNAPNIDMIPAVLQDNNKHKNGTYGSNIPQKTSVHGKNGGNATSLVKNPFTVLLYLLSLLYFTLLHCLFQFVLFTHSMTSYCYQLLNIY